MGFSVYLKISMLLWLLLQVVASQFFNTTTASRTPTPTATQAPATSRPFISADPTALAIVLSLVGIVLFIIICVVIYKVKASRNAKREAEEMRKQQESMAEAFAASNGAASIHSEATNYTSTDQYGNYVVQNHAGAVTVTTYDQVPAPQPLSNMQYGDQYANPQYASAPNPMQVPYGNPNMGQIPPQVPQNPHGVPTTYVDPYAGPTMQAQAQQFKAPEQPVPNPSSYKDPYAQNANR